MSGAFESNRLVSTAPNLIENAPFLDAGPGGGVREEEQGQINIKATINYPMLNQLFNDAQGSGRQTIYGCPSTAVQNVKRDDIAWVIPPTEDELKNADLLGEQGMPLVGTSLNGIGRSVVTEFPDDEDVWQEWIQHTAKVLGPVITGVQTAGLESPHISVQVNGLTWPHAQETMPVGYYARAIARKPSELLRNVNMHRPNELYSKVTFGLEPVRPSTYSQLIKVHVDRYLTQQSQYEAAFNMGYRKTQSMAASMQHLFAYTKMAFLCFLDELIKVAGLDVTGLAPQYNPFGGAFPANVTNDGGERQRLVAALAKGMGLLPDHSVFGAGFTDESASLWGHLTRQCLVKTLVPQNYLPLSLGYDGQVDRAVDNEGSPIRDTAIGELAWIQFNAADLLYSNLSDTFSRIQSQIVGLVIRGANADTVTGIYWRPT